MFGALYDRYGRVVFTVVLPIVGDRFSAEDVIQHVFHVVWQHSSGFRPASGTGAAWVVGITRHRAIERIRSQRHKARQRDVSIDDDAGVILRDRRNVEYEAVIRSDVRQALAELPAEQRQALGLAYYGGLSATEIASSTATPVGTVKTRLRLGLSKLRAALLPGWLPEEGTITCSAGDR